MGIPLIGVGAALVIAWIALVIALAVARPRGGLLQEAMRILPDTLRLIRRLAADRTLPPGVRIRLGLLLVYLAIPVRMHTGFHPGARLCRRRRNRHCCPA